MTRTLSMTIGLLAVLLAGCMQASPTALPPPAGVEAPPSPDPTASDAAAPAAAAPASSPALPPAESIVAIDPVAGDQRVVLGDRTVTIDAECEATESSLRRCGPARIGVESPGSPARFVEVDTLLFAARPSAYRGPLDSPQDQSGRTVVLADLNVDGREDLALWTGTSGGYGSASFDVFLGTADGFQHDVALSALTHGATGLFTVDHGQLVRMSKSGCCLFTTERYAFDKGAPLLVEQAVEDSTSNRSSPVITVRRRVDGRMQVVSP